MIFLILQDQYFPLIKVFDHGIETNPERTLAIEIPINIPDSPYKWSPNKTNGIVKTNNLPKNTIVAFNGFWKPLNAALAIFDHPQKI